MNRPIARTHGASVPLAVTRQSAFSGRARERHPPSRVSKRASSSRNSCATRRFRPTQVDAPQPPELSGTEEGLRPREGAEQQRWRQPPQVAQASGDQPHQAERRGGVERQVEEQPGPQPTQHRAGGAEPGRAQPRGVQTEAAPSRRVADSQLPAQVIESHRVSLPGSPRPRAAIRWNPGTRHTHRTKTSPPVGNAARGATGAQGRHRLGARASQPNSRSPRRTRRRREGAP